MDFKTQTNQQPQQSQPAPRNDRPAAPVRGSGNKSKLIALVTGIVVFLVLVVCLVFLLQTKQNAQSGNTGVETDKYQAVFMTNGQVYFGRLSHLGGEYAQLTDIYYLQVQQPVQPAAEKKETDQPQVSLTKLGNELHGPTDKMHISSEQILFWENLKSDSTVVKAIEDYKKKQN